LQQKGDFFNSFYIRISDLANIMPKDSINVGGKKYYYEYDSSHPNIRYGIQHLENLDRRGLSLQEAGNLFESAHTKGARSSDGLGRADFQDEVGRNFSVEAKVKRGFIGGETVTFKLVPRKQ
jgi:hypothetical protein